MFGRLWKVYPRMRVKRPGMVLGEAGVCPKLEGSSYQLLTREMERWNPCEIGYAPVA